MARQAGPIPLRGALGDYVYYKRDGAYFVRRKGNLDAARVRQDPAFAGTRAQNGRMAFASKASKLIRAAFGPWTGQMATANLHNRICSRLLAANGEPAALPGLLAGIEWQPAAPLPHGLRHDCSLQIDPAKGRFELMVQPPPPEELLGRAKGATHYRIIAVLAAISLSRGTFKTAGDETGFLSCRDGQAGSFILSARLRYRPAGSVLLLGMGLQAYEVVSSEDYALVQGGSFGLIG